MENEHFPHSDLRAVSLFSNCGAGDLGFRNAGFRFVLLAEIEPRRLEVAMRNHAGAYGVPGDLNRTWSTVVDLTAHSLRSQDLDLLAACPPCQGMSTARSNRGLEDDPDAGSRDGRNLLVLPIAKVAKALRPRAIVVENVPAFLSRKVRDPRTGSAVSAAALLVSLLISEYEVFPLLADLAEFGVPQTRRRCFLTFLRRDEAGLAAITAVGATPYPIPLVAQDHGGNGFINLGSILNKFNLPRLDAGSEDLARARNRRLHCVPVWDKRYYSMIDAIPAGSGRSAWENNRCRLCGDLEIGQNEVVCPLCGEPLLKPIKLDSESGDYRFVNGFRRSSYRRLSLDKPAATITTASGRLSSDRTIHPTENRVLSVLECALLQTIPEEFDWGGALDYWGEGQVRAMIGEAVPPLFTYMHGAVLRQLLNGGDSSQLLRYSDVRCEKARRKLGKIDMGGIGDGLLLSREEKRSDESGRP